jgi:membrane protein implicated in regulation of membrane protease activity
VLLAVGLAVVVVASVLAGIDSINGAGLAVLAAAGLLIWLFRVGERPPDGPDPATGRPPAASSPAQPYQPYQPVTLPRPVLGRATVYVVLIAVGLLLAADVAGLGVPTSAYPALALLVVAAGLLIGSWYGRARGLIALGLVLSLVTFAAAGAGEVDRQFSGRTVDERVVVERVDQIPTDADFAAGQIQYDLSGLDVNGLVPGAAGPAGGPPALRARVGLGEVVVVVPPGLDVIVDARVGLGELDVFGSDDGGAQTRITQTDLGDDGPGGGQLKIYLSAGFGHVEVRRATS